MRPSCPHLYPESQGRLFVLRTLGAPPWILASALLSRHPPPASGIPTLFSLFPRENLNSLGFRSREGERAPLRLALTPRSSSSSRRGPSMAQPAAPAPIARLPRQRSASSSALSADRHGSAALRCAPAPGPQTWWRLGSLWMLAGGAGRSQCVGPASSPPSPPTPRNRARPPRSLREGRGGKGERTGKSSRASRPSKPIPHPAPLPGARAALFRVRPACCGLESSPLRLPRAAAPLTVHSLAHLPLPPASASSPVPCSLPSLYQQ